MPLLKCHYIHGNLISDAKYLLLLPQHSIVLWLCRENAQNQEISICCIISPIYNTKQPLNLLMLASQYHVISLSIKEPWWGKSV
jgi:hypothetical protein